ncbi:hypothetical protein KI387_026917, partial [Taxus chinensis]
DYDEWIPAISASSLESIQSSFNCSINVVHLAFPLDCKNQDFETEEDDLMDDEELGVAPFGYKRKPNLTMDPLAMSLVPQPPSNSNPEPQSPLVPLINSHTIDPLYDSVLEPQPTITPLKMEMGLGDSCHSTLYIWLSVNLPGSGLWVLGHFHGRKDLSLGFVVESVLPEGTKGIWAGHVLHCSAGNGKH